LLLVKTVRHTLVSFISYNFVLQRVLMDSMVWTVQIHVVSVETASLAIRYQEPVLTDVTPAGMEPFVIQVHKSTRIWGRISLCFMSSNFSSIVWLTY